MRPIRLTMQAFGPYADREIVDFREALGNGLFGIYGSTGSGKSTIFSAMTFALFGEAAKSDQDTSTLRSDHSDADRLTEVELIFEIGDKRYLIRRKPEQIRPKQRGEGETKDGHEAWFFDVTGIDVDTISDENSGKVIAEKKVGAVKAAVTERLGYGVEQFKQIVLLPQGKFEAFLTAKTDERLKILRELFDVSLYRRLAAKMKEDAKAAEETVRRDRDVCARRLEQEGYESPDALKEGIAAAKETHTELSEKAKTAQAKAADTEARLNKAIQLDEKFVESERASAALAELEVKAEEIAALTIKVKHAEIARSLLDIEATVTGTEGEVNAALKQQKEAQGDQESAVKAATDAAARLTDEKGKSAETEVLRRKADGLVRHKATLEATKALNTKAGAVKKALEAASSVYDVADQQQRALVSKQSDATSALKTARSATDQRANLQTQVEAAERALGSAQEHEAAVKALNDAKALLAQALARQTSVTSARTATQAKFDEAEKALSGAQALHLAEKLEDGAPCPVCGSEDHPSPATGTAMSAGLDQAFREVKDALEKTRQEETCASSDISSAEAVTTERWARLNNLTSPEQLSAVYRETANELAQQIKELGPVINLKTLEDGLERLSTEIHEAQQATAEARGEKQDATTKEALARQELESALKTVPVDIQALEALEAAIAETDSAIKERVEAVKTAEEIEKETREAALAAKKDVEGACKAHEAAVKRHQDIKAMFENRLHEHGMMPADYQAHKASIADIETDEASITAHKEARAVAKNKATSSAVAIKDMERPELDTLRQSNAAANETKETAVNEAATALARVNALEALLTSISNELARLEKMEKESAPIRDLAAAFNAHNPSRLDLETFAIGAMFDQVLAAANLRLGPMTNGRYILERELEGGKGVARRGLGICVHDIHTGRPRATSTLSGGETFIAALALALGLSDIVESVTGNIRLDTIFIDEGFGSLDTENDAGTLDQVLQTLTDLIGQNRAVGLISHVPLVQQTIPNGFWIRKTLTGSHIEQRGLQT